jgi:2-keto-4-pentenoate hydratase/2-oxohepta-3-ene-1,7-dioic acid hydratase in catechol pathway
MKLVTYRKLDGRLSIGELREDGLYSFETDMSMVEIAAGKELPDRTETFKVMKHLGIVAPLMPRKIFCVGRNYADHAAELKNELPKSPLIFSKYPSSVIGTGEKVQWRKNITQQVDWEGELVVVIGQGGKNISEANANEHIFGYTIANDISARDLQDSESQWVRAKSQDTFCPLGPAIITADEMPDPHNLHLKTEVNGETVQDASTKDMIFKIPYLVSYLSQTFTLEAGDIILTGTPAGVGKGMKPPRFLKHDDEVSVTIDGIGTLTNRCEIEA